MHVALETDRLIRRRFTPDDGDHLVRLDSDPAVMRYATGGTTTSREAIAHDFLPAFLDYYTRFDGYGFWAVIEKATDRILGWFQLRPRPGIPREQPALGDRLRREAWGKGYGTEGARALIQKGFAELGAERATAIAFRENLASRRVMEKAGMRLMRAYRLSPAQLVELGIADSEHLDRDVVEYALTKPEWTAQHRSVQGAQPER